MNIRQLNVLNHDTARQVLKIQRAAYAVEAELIGSTDIPPLHETLDALQQSHETFYGYFVDEQLAGVIAYQLDGDTLDIYRLMVHPDYFRQGIASQLLTFVEGLHTDMARCIVSTGSLNAPAKALYQRLAFAKVGEKEVVPGLVITLFEKQIQSNE